MKTREFLTMLVITVLALASAVSVTPIALAQGPPVDNFPSSIAFDYLQNEFPEGVAVDKIGNVYVSLRFSPSPLNLWGPIPGSDQIWKFTPDGKRSKFFDFGGTLGGGAVGLAVDAEGNVYMARSIAPSGSAFGKGVFRIDREGNAVLLPGTDQIGFPDGLAFDDRGNLYITEAHSSRSPTVCGPPTLFGISYGPGGIWVVPKGGIAKLWLSHNLLTGECPGVALRPFGANGIAYYHRNLYVINSDKATVVQVPVLDDGNAGQPQNWANLQEIDDRGTTFWGAPPVGDSLTMDVKGNV